MTDSSSLVTNCQTSAVTATQIPMSCVVFTPPSLAAGMVRALGDTRTTEWLDPCVGQGAFLKALSAAQVPPHRIRALDIAPTPSSYDGLAKTLRSNEFLHWSVTTDERFDQIIANPPFAALNRMPAAIQTSAMKIVVPGTGSHVGLGANAWFAFLCGSISLLRVRGSLAFVLPAAWDYADYAAPLRTSIPRLFEEVEVHRCAQPLFDSVLDGTIVLVARRYLAQTGSVADAALKMRRRTYTSPERLIDALGPSSSPSVRVSASKRLVATAGEVFPDVSSTNVVETTVAHSPPKLRLGDVVQIRLGGVTGDASFFVLSEEQRRSRGLPVAACRPIVSRARHLTGGVIGKADWDRLKDNGERIWLFDPPPSLTQHADVKAYLERSVKEGGCKRSALKVRTRDPWYRTPLEPRIDGFMSGMSGRGPWVVFRQMDRLAATNTLYVVRFLKSDNLDDRAVWAMWLLTSEATRLLRRIARRYADGLVKFEPGDIADLPIRKPTTSKGAFAVYNRAVRLLLEGKKSASRREADEWFTSSQRRG